jgi:hypothetical protein
MEILPFSLSLTQTNSPAKRRFVQNIGESRLLITADAKSQALKLIPRLIIKIAIDDQLINSNYGTRLRSVATQKIMISLPN